MGRKPNRKKKKIPGRPRSGAELCKRHSYSLPAELDDLLEASFEIDEIGRSEGIKRATKFYLKIRLRYKEAYLRYAFNLVNETAIKGFKPERWQIERIANEICIKFDEVIPIDEIMGDLEYAFDAAATNGRIFTPEAIEAEISKRFAPVPA